MDSPATLVSPASANSTVDHREQLFNGGEVGRIEQVQVSAERIVKLNGVLFDLDPRYYRASTLLPIVPLDPHEFYHAIAQHWLSRHPLLMHCQVRNSGTGLHAILWFDEPVVITSDEDRQRWTGVIKTIQSALPIDPDQPHITAVTRPPGSINGKNGSTVVVLCDGDRVSQDGVLKLYNEMTDAPFSTVMNILAGSTQLEPCPICANEESRLTGLNYVGRCYGSCGTVKLEQLYDVLFAPRNGNGKEAGDDDANCE